MDSTVETLKGIFNKELGKYKALSDKIKPLLDEQRILEEKIEHYKKLISLEGGQLPSQAVPPQEVTPPTFERTKFPSARSAMRRLVEQTDGEFTINDIKTLFEEKFPSMSFSKHSFHNLLGQMIQEGAATLIASGVGRSPSRYGSVKQIRLF